MKLCLGTVQFGMDYGIQGAKKASHNEIDRILDYATGHGIAHLDCAAAYGEANNVVGRYIRNSKYGREWFRIISKIPAGAFDKSDSADWSEIALQNARQELETIGVDKFEAYLFHNASLLYKEGAVSALYQVKTEGLSNKIGVSVYSPDEAIKALSYKEIEVIQAPYNVFDHRLDKCDFFKKAGEKGVEIYARSTLLQGLIMMHPNELPKKMRFAGRYISGFRELCKKAGFSPLEAAISYVMQRPGVNYIVFGVDNIDQLRDYISIAEHTMPPEFFSELNREFEGVDEKLVNPTLW